MTQDERADVTLAFRDSDFRLTHPNPKFHQEPYHVVGRACTPVEGVSLRFSTLGEGRDLVWECLGHLAMPDVLTFATAADQGAPMPAVPAMAEVFAPLGQAWSAIIGGADPTETMNQTHETIAQAIAGQ